MSSSTDAGMAGPLLFFSVLVSCLLSASPDFLVVICCGCEHILKVMCKLEVNGCFFLLIILTK